MKIIYTGVFFKEFKKCELSRKIKTPHVTFEYMPKVVDETLFGKQVTFRVVGYACNKENEGYFVEFVDGPKEIKEQFEKIAVPHITLSVGQGGRPVNTRYLKFQPIKPFEVKGIFGGFQGNKKIKF